MVIEINFKEVAAIHYANGYDKDPKAQHWFNLVSNDLGGAAWANAYNSQHWDDYADAVMEIDDEPFAVY